MKKILVTGGAGFIGHHFVEHALKSTDWDVVVLDRLDTAGNLNRLADIECFESNKHRIKFVWHDLKSEINESVGSFLLRDGERFDYIFHFAAASHVDRSITDPMSFVMDNMVGTCNLLNFARDRLIVGGKFFNFSTDEVFGSAPDNYRHKETDAWHPSNPYSASKAGQSALGYAYFITYGLPIITTFTMNNFGERQHPEKFIPKIIRAVRDDKPITIHAKIEKDGSVLQVGVRHWLHCRNTASALFFLVEHGVPGEFYNVIGFDELTNLEMASKIAGIMGKVLKVEYVDFHKSRPGHDRRYALDGTKLKKLGWTPPVNFDKTLKRTVEWTLAHPEWL